MKKDLRWEGFDFLAGLLCLLVVILNTRIERIIHRVPAMGKFGIPAVTILGMAAILFCHNVANLIRRGYARYQKDRAPKARPQR
jgi:hypothetical protein